MFPVSASALSWQDYFPPIKLEESSRKPPGNAIAPEVVGGLDAYSNTLDNQLRCDKIIKIANSWEPKETQVGTDKDGNPIMGYRAQDARDLKEQKDIQNISNNGFRNFQSLFAKGEIKNNIQSTEDNFKDMNISGMSAFTRMNSIFTLDVERSHYLIDVVESLKPFTNAKDVVAQDIQIAWDCHGTIVSLSTKSKNTTDCRPITVSEILYGLREQPLYFTDDYSLPATTFPSETLSFINSYYPGKYQDRFGKKFSELPLETYLSIYYQLNAPKGNVNSRIRVVNYDGYDTTAQKPILPVVTSVQRNLPAAVAVAAAQAKTFNKISSVNAPPLPNSTDLDYCKNFSQNNTIALDKPPVITVAMWVKGLFKHLAPGESYHHEERIELSYRNDAGMVENSRIIEQNLLQLIPSNNIDKNKYLDQTFSSTTDSNEKYGIVDPLNRGDTIYTNAFAKFLLPASWQKLQ